MKENEKQLFKALCKFKDTAMNEELSELAAPAMLGHLFFNRMQGIAFLITFCGLDGCGRATMMRRLIAAPERDRYTPFDLITACDVVGLAKKYTGGEGDEEKN